MNLPWQTVEPLPPTLFAQIRHRTIFECCKWDPQVEDVSTLCPFPLILNHADWQEISLLAEELASETMAIEAELVAKPSLHKQLSFPRSIRKIFEQVSESKPSAGSARIMRFDFHFTTHGWKISEANTDVPGGFVEASGFTSLISEQYPGTSFSSPADMLADAMAETAREHRIVALVHATAFTDDRQVMVFLAKKLEHRGIQAVLVAPDHLRWANGKASVASDWFNGPVDFVFRFFPAEWLPNLPRRCDWFHFFHGSETPLCNPATALLTQSKRLPIVWNQLATKAPAWRRLLPETAALSQVDWSNERDWVLKPALGRVGESIGLYGATDEKEWKSIRKAARRDPDEWIAQRRFEPVPLFLNNEKTFPCIGVYTIDGRAAGAYGRISSNGLINHRAQDIAVLVANPSKQQQQLVA